MVTFEHNQTIPKKSSSTFMWLYLSVNQQVLFFSLFQEKYWKHVWQVGIVFYLVNREHPFYHVWHAVSCSVFCTGGSEWVLEDTIELKDIKIPDPQVEIELSQVMLTQQIFPPGLSLHNTPFSDIPGLTPTLSSAPMVSMPRTKSVPSLSTIQSVRKSIAEQVGG